MPSKHHNLKMHTLTPAGDRGTVSFNAKGKTHLSTKKEARWAPKPVPWCIGHNKNIFLWHNL